MTSPWVSFAISIWLYVLQGNRAGGCFLMPVIKSLLGLLGTWTLTFRARKPSKLLRVSNSYSGADPHRLPPKANEIGQIFHNKCTFSNKKYLLSWNRSWRNLLLVPQDPTEACAFGACLGNRSVSILDPCLLFIPSAVNFFFFPGKDWSTKISQWNGHSTDEPTLQMPLSKCSW